jgi:hypothetical protein
MIIRGDHFSGLGVADDVCDLALAIEDVDRHEDHPRASHTRGRDRSARCSSRGAAAREQRVRDAIASRVDLAERVRLPHPVERRLGRAGDEREIEKVKKVHEAVAGRWCVVQETTAHQQPATS